MSIAHVCLASLGRGLQIILQPPYLCSLHTCSPQAQVPKGIIQESLVLQPSQYSQRTKTCFWPPEVITSPTCYICYIYSYHNYTVISAFSSHWPFQWKELPNYSKLLHYFVSMPYTNNNIRDFVIHEVPFWRQSPRNFTQTCSFSIICS